MPEGVLLAADQRHVAALDGRRALGDDDDRRVVRLEPLLDVLAHLLDVEGLLGDQHDVGAAGDAGVQRDPAGVPAHHLDDQHPVVRLGGRVQPVDRLHRDVDRGVEAEGEVGAGEVVVDRLRDADDVDAEVGELGGDAEGVLAADRDQRVDPVGREVVLDPLDAAVDLERVGARGLQDRAAARQDAADLVDAERGGQVLQRPAPAVEEADELEAVLPDALADDGPDDGVQAGAVAAAGQHSHAHASRLLGCSGVTVVHDPSDEASAASGGASIVPRTGPSAWMHG